MARNDEKQFWIGTPSEQVTKPQKVCHNALFITKC